MSTVRIRRSPDAPWAVDLDQFELKGIQPGQEVDVPAEMAGHPPYWRNLETGETKVPWREYRTQDGHPQIHDLGEGLLAQLGNWEPADPSTPDAGSGTDDEKGTA